ncbi:DUF1173 domain-containing protein [Mesorhizobium sp. M1A.F.Ca.ET.072.01.1.1]|uniref:DUF1173 domain-containing protein n=1 Tax=Mesorhizobium sp. M1A.F.Ca.ET.072.01.1.1 TaxID=2496753 RepID=UPI000FD409BF|nr:DUF1173 domain-containing protein [Mesorhizobium sp. M1A.F.Ca.ET.072.01.1.1]RUW48661.1 DUF1173 domain-containing protein [Mesorhizobium sp. M1A.F.Ca.ET.072.01.1.1]TIU99512.1 MAG: DUF1173 family protein [Mesorhizobium sp.]
MRRYRIGGSLYFEDAPELQEALTAAHQRHERPLCMCRGGGLPMYIARMGSLYVIKRMPLSGGEHDPSCASYESPYELSGLGALMGSAIQLDPQSGMAALKLDFSLSKIGSRAASPQASPGSDSVSGEAKKLSLRGLLHYLWHEAELTVWTSLWAGKRHWWNVQWHLREAAKQMIVKGRPLAETLYVPEAFRAEKKDAIERRRAEALAPLATSGSGPRKLMILVGEVKEFEPARAGHKLVIRHMPGFPFMVDGDLHGRLRTRFDREFSLWEADDRSHLMAIATFGVNAAGLAVIEEIAVMVVNENWIPYDSVHERKLVDALARMQDKSIKGLRYNLPAEQPIANAMVQRLGQSIALYIVPVGVDDKFELMLNDMIEARPQIGSWIWRVSEGEMPSLQL